MDNYFRCISYIYICKSFTFVLILIAGLLYAWRKGALQWSYLLITQTMKRNKKE
ncbi:hypothetical protein DCAR_0832878 [Daucus carota subsp. sativus]|uniref:NADH-ubiquinone oxidoreductase chain 3 n=1 Tax=Daucus carota subsp. sativus TaxID=79200 RepID=A0AAF0XSA1_DAUCS|nr:hypothetical protein DCAR_0832878 [Daucus carota subsp. sativus]